MDSRTCAPPTFQFVPSFLKYVGEGHEGLLGYCNRINCSDSLSRFARMHLPVVQDAYENLNFEVDLLKQKSMEQEELCSLLHTQL